MDVYGSLKELVSLILRKSGKTITIAAPATVNENYEYKLPNTEANASAVLVTDTHAQTLTNKTLTAPAIGDFSGANHDHSEASKGGQLSDSAIAAGAAIARSKIAAGTASHVITNDANGILSSEAQLDRTRGGTGITSTATFPASGTVAVMTDITVSTVGTSNISTALNGAAALTDGAIATGAAIARSKIASGTAAHVVINDGSGNLSSEAQLAASRGGTGITSTATFPASGTVAVIADITTQVNVNSINSHAIPVGTDAFVTADASQTLTQKTLTQPTIANFTSANHDHSDASKGGLIVAASPTQQGAVTVTAQSLAGLKTFNDGIATDTIAEKTAAAGVTIDSALVKDGTFRASSTDANRLPVGTTAQRSSAAAGNIRHNSDIGTVEFHDGTNWVPAAKIKTVSLVNGSADLYTPETGVLAYEALVYSSVGTATSLTNILVVNDNGAWTYSASEAGDTVVVITVNTSTGKLSLAATGSGTCKSRISVIM